MPKKLRVGIVGCGKIADVNHIPGYLALKGVQITSLLDIVASRTKEKREKHSLDAECFTDWDAFVASGLDAVSICTPNNLHYPQTMAALKAGLHVLCEKPMAASLGECSRMIAAAKKAKRVLQINQSLRYHRVYQKMAELVADGEIGDPIHIRCIRSGGSTPDKGWSPGARWFVSKASQGGLILDIGVHMADVMQWYLGETVEVAAHVDTRIKTIDVPDNVSALMRYKSGATGVLELSWTMPVGGNMLEIYGTKGAIRQGFNPDHPIELLKPATQKKRLRITYPKPKAKVPDSQRCFLDAIRGKAPSLSPGELGRDAIALCDAIAKSGESGRFIKVKRF